MKDNLILNINQNLIDEANKIFCELGITPALAVKMFYQSVVYYSRIPDGCKIPNKETIAAINEDLKDAKRYKSVEEMLSDME